MRHLKIYLLLLIARALYRSALRKHQKATARMRWANAVLSQAACARVLPAPPRLCASIPGCAPLISGG